MKILVCISKVPDTTTKIRFTADNTKLDEANVQFILNPYDEWYALVRACELVEAGEGTVTVIHVGPAGNDVIIRKALAIGAQEAFRVDAEPLDADYVALQIAEHARGGDYDMILTGKETIDYNGSVLGGMLAERLDLPYVSLCSKLDVEGSRATLVRDVEGGKETLEVDMPFVASAQKGMAEARIPNMRGIMMAKRKPLEVISPVDAEPATRFARFRLPPEKAEVRLVDADRPEELVRLLHEEAKAI